MTSRLYDAERRLPCPRRASSATGKGPGYRPFLPTGAERALEECSGAVGEVCDLGIEARGATNRRKTPPPVECRKFDEFPSIAFDDTKARLDNLAVELQNSPDLTAYVIIYAGRASRAGQADALGRRAMDYLTTSRGVDPRRIIVINGGYRDSDFIEIWLCPQGATPPQPSPAVNPNQVTPAQERTRPRKPRRRGE